jgi:hypothetical protein|tara:strand:- start:1602 stop:2774 length:1173 start_codon:yes stop_codon:yes gene_type:complete
MHRIVTLLAVLSMNVLPAVATSAEAETKASVVLAAMADGIGDLTFASPQWVDAAQEALAAAASKHADGLKDLGKFTLCEVGHNPPAYLHAGAKLAWYATFNGPQVTAHTGEAKECDIKIQGDHAIMSNLGRIQYHGNDPKVVAAAQARLGKLSRWEIEGSMPENEVLAAVFRSLHDTMAARTMPRFVFMTPEWVSTARHILSTRATLDEYADGISDVVYTFSEEFTDTPRYAFPDGSHGGFWVHCNYGQITVGAGALPKELEPADFLTKGIYTPVVPVGRTVNAAMTETEKAEQGTYSAAAFRIDEKTNERPISQTQPSGKGPMPPALGRVMMTLHDELGKRTSGELPSDFDQGIKSEWATAQNFDRSPDYASSWVRYDEVDIYAEPLSR